jgi:hypothetical protein
VTVEERETRRRRERERVGSGFVRKYIIYKMHASSKIDMMMVIFFDTTSVMK